LTPEQTSRRCADSHTDAYYTGGGSDFVDVNAALDGTQITLTGTVSGPPKQRHRALGRKDRQGGEVSA